MTADRYTVLGLAHPRAGWFARLARWSTTGAAAVDFVKCVSAADVRARVDGQRFSALLAGGDCVGLDRDLIDELARAAVPVIVVGWSERRDWHELGAVGTLAADFDEAALGHVLRQHATPVQNLVVAPSATTAAPTSTPGLTGTLLAVTGAPGAGGSTTAMALAQGLAAAPGRRGMILLADLALDADLAMLHDAGDVAPGISELVDAHRRGRLPTEETRALTFDVVDRGYHLLLGLRRHRDWTSIRPHAFGSALESMCRAYRTVVADIDADLEGEAETGSVDVEGRNVMARSTTARADLVICVGAATTHGVHALARTVRGLTAGGVEPGRIRPVCNRAPRSRRRRAEISAALAALTGAQHREMGNPLFLGERTELDNAIREGVALPSALTGPLVRCVERALGTFAERTRDSVGGPTPELVRPGSLGSWPDEEGER